MMAFRSRFTKIIPVLACALCAVSLKCLGPGSRFRSAEWWAVPNLRRAPC